MAWAEMNSGGGLQIIQVNLTSENPQPIVPGMNVEFTYSVRWAPSAIPFPRRFERYLDYNFFEHQVRQGIGCDPKQIYIAIEKGVQFANSGQRRNQGTHSVGEAQFNIFWLSKPGALWSWTFSSGISPTRRSVREAQRWRIFPNRCTYLLLLWVVRKPVRVSAVSGVLCMGC